ncbi:MAG: sugar transferase [Altibacter sp.]|uniref:sugar transferase n=1 Tax=Altibacter sp. TaxID=2024823 RepID=UPI001DD0ACCC|nr:sugar transferase [Altibacter sp.]MBZ0328380.1 sugar transferase [Altibacter sp.]
MLTKKQLVLKRFFDLSFSLLILPFVIIPLILLLLIASVNTGSSGIFVQERIGRFGKHFKLFKVRSLKGENHKDALEIQQSETSFGRWIRSSKLDELPQLFNVLKGDMSWVGPRPDVPGYADNLKGEDRIILTVRPGITGPATLKYKDEDAVLLQQTDPNWYNDHVIWPDKVNINKAYIESWSLQKDIYYLFASVFK